VVEQPSAVKSQSQIVGLPTAEAPAELIVESAIDRIVWLQATARDYDYLLAT
jgi:hypothetical protein